METDRFCGRVKLDVPDTSLPFWRAYKKTVFLKLLEVRLGILDWILVDKNMSKDDMTLVVWGN